MKCCSTRVPPGKHFVEHLVDKGHAVWYSHYHLYGGWYHVCKKCGFTFSVSQGEIMVDMGTKKYFYDGSTCSDLIVEYVLC